MRANAKNAGAKPLIALALILFALPVAFSLGVSPGRTILEPSHGETHEMQIIITNPTDSEKNVEISVGNGSFNEYIALEEGIVTIGPRGMQKVPFTFTQPSYNVGYGRVCNGIRASEVPEHGVDGIFAVVEVIYTLCVEYPYPGKYLEISLSANPVNEGTESTYALLKAVSKGSEHIDFLTGKLFLKDEEGETIAEYDAPMFESLMPRAQETGHVEIMTEGLRGGNYVLEGHFNYDGNRVKENASLVIGYPDIDVVRHTPSVRAGSSENFEVVLKNNFLSEFKVVFFDLEIGDGGRFRFRSPPTGLKRLEVKSLDMLISTKNLEIGQYPSTITVYFDDYRKTVETTVNVVEKSERDIPGQVPEKSMVPVIVLIVLSNVLIILLIILLLSRKDIDEERI
jgi:hypothetical protein